MDGKELVILFILLFLAAAAAGIWVSVRRESKRRKPFEELLEESLALPRLDGGSCKAWFQEKNRAYPGENLGLLQYADQKLLDMLGYDCPEQVDLAQYAVQMLVREKTGECLALRLINFEATAPNLKEKLDQGGLTVTF